VKFLPQDQLEAFLAHLAESAIVVAPQRDQDGVLFFQPWEAGAEVEFEQLLTRQSPKDYVFRQTETYLKFGYEMKGKAAAEEEEAGGGKKGEAGAAEEAPPAEGEEPAHEVLQVEAVEDAPEQVIFGLRPCDARGYYQMDQVFGGYGGFYYDPYYMAKREATTLVALTCAQPWSTCFCTAVYGSPSGTDGVDLLLTGIEGGFTAETVTERGENLLGFGGFADVGNGQADAAQTVKDEAFAAIDPPFEIEGVPQGLRDNFEDPAWHDLHMRCISCGTCTYVCPNCYCFNITDEMVENSGERVRTWDNCFNPGYTLETSGHNPREQKFARFRNRFSHKFSYYPEKYDSLLCSGCGRCIRYCPTKIDLREVIRTLGQPHPDQAAPAEDGEAAGVHAQTGEDL